MTREQLNGHIALRREKRQAEETLASLRAAASPGAQILTGMPHGTGISDKTGDLAAEIVDVETQIERLEQEIAAQEPEIDAFLGEIRNSRTRTIFRLRLLKGYSWKEISSILGKYSSPHSVSGSFYSYLKRIGLL